PAGGRRSGGRRCRFGSEPVREHGGRLQKVVDLHGFTWVMAAVGVAHEQHGGGHAGDREGGGVVGGRACERHRRNAQHLGGVDQLGENVRVRGRHVGGCAGSQLE